MGSTTSTIDRGHPITVTAAQIHEQLDALTEASTWSMSEEETRATLRELTRLIARAAQLELRVAAHAEANRVGDASGATSTAAWWANQTRQTRAEAHRKIRLAKALDADQHQTVRRALAAGRVLPDQAGVIVAAVDALPGDAEGWVKPKAEAWLLDQAGVHDAKSLRVLASGSTPWSTPRPRTPTRRSSWSARSRTPRRRRCSGWSRTGTARCTASSPSPPPTPRSCARPYRR